MRVPLAIRSSIRHYATETTSNLRKPAFPIKSILADPQKYQRSVNLRGTKLFENQTIADLVRQFEHVANLKKQRQKVATERNKVVEDVKRILAMSKKRDVLPNELRQRSASCKAQMAELERELALTSSRLDLLLDTVPNLVEPSAARIEGDYDVVSQTTDELIPFSKDRDHVTIGTELGILDIAAASRVCGTGNAYLVGKGALLEQALIQYALLKCTQHHGFKLVSPPSLIRSEFIDACGFKPRDESTHVYRVENENLCLSGTAEIPLASQLAETCIETPLLPEMRCGVTRSFRAEAASKGADTRGLYRLHEFSKVEMFVWVKPEEEASAAMLDKLTAIQLDIYHDLLVADLNIPLRLINIAPNDLGAPAYQKFDIEAWMPGRGTWGEISSASNCLDFQARRLHTVDSDGKYLHTLNATALAVPRIIVALIENGWDPKTRKVRLPRVLHPFMGSEFL